jgi:hypothetical protein
MSRVYVSDDYGFVGWAGQNVRLSAGDQYDTSDQIVQDMPHLFTAKAPEGVEVEEQPKRRGRRG